MAALFTQACLSVRMATAQSEIIEGFLCPMCMKDFGTVTQLQHHFEDAHNAEDKAVFQQLKGNPNDDISDADLASELLFYQKHEG